MAIGSGCDLAAGDVDVQLGARRERRGGKRRESQQQAVHDAERREALM